jgi:SMC interacting uncharacterized protein involved in chromosome segregation
MKYKARVKQTVSQIEAKQLEHDVNVAKLQVQSDLLATKLKLSQEEAKLDTLKSATPFSLSAVVEQTAVVSDYQAGLTIAESIVAELF